MMDSEEIAEGRNMRNLNENKKKIEYIINK